MKRVRYFAGYSRPRLYVVVGMFGLSFLAILARLTVVQVGQYSYWRDSAEAQYGRRITVAPQRGSILDRRNNVLAASIPAPSVYVAPREVKEPEVAAQKIASVFPSLSEERLKRQLTSSARFVWLARQVSPEKAAALQALRLPGIHVKKETRRIYPRGFLAGSTIGYAGIDEQGLGGLEHQYDGVLSAQPLRASGTRDARGRTGERGPRRPFGAASRGGPLPDAGREAAAYRRKGACRAGTGHRRTERTGRHDGPLYRRHSRLGLVSLPSTRTITATKSNEPGGETAPLPTLSSRDRLSRSSPQPRL